MSAHRITLLPSGRAFPAREGETLLAAALRAGEALPAGCRTGACHTCAARLRAGKVALPSDTTLSREQHREGLVLTCVTRARGDCTLELTPDLLPTRPWTE